MKPSRPLPFPRLAPALAALAALPVLAQPGPRRVGADQNMARPNASLMAGQMPPRRGMEHPGGQEESLLGDLFLLRVTRIRQTLGVPEDRARALAERWRQWDRELFTCTRELHHLRRRFNDILMGPWGEEEKSARMRPLLDEFLRVRARLDMQKHRFEDDIRTGLSPVQQARVILMVEEFQQRLREGIRALREP